MQINRDNYEAYFLDYREENLSTKEVAELMIFLEQYPEYKSEFDNYENISIKPEQNINFKNKDSLKKRESASNGKINESNYEAAIIAGLEEELSDLESEELKKFLGINPQYKLEYNYFKRTFLVPDNQIKFENKRSLKKGGLVSLNRPKSAYVLSIAASIIILLGIYFASNRSSLDLMSSRDSGPVEKFNGIMPGKFETGKLSNIPNRSLFDNIRSVPREKITPDHNRINSITSVRIKNVSEIEIEENNYIEAIGLKNSSVINDLAQNEIHEDRPVKNAKKSFVSRFITGLTHKYAVPKSAGKKSFLEYTVEGYNIMADREVEVEKETDEYGNVIAYNINGEKLTISRKVKENSAE